MSRIGKRPITVPKSVTVTYENRLVTLKGPKGEHRFEIPPEVELDVGDGVMHVVADYHNDADARRVMGTVNAVLTNMVTGVAEGFTRRLTLTGVGYRANVQGKNMELSLGYSHPVRMVLPEHVSAEVQGNVIALSSHDNVLVGQVAANIRSMRPPEPYQGKGVAYEGERIRRKAGKTGKK